MDIDEYYHSEIVLGAEGAAFFRSQKARQYPEDERNQQSADALAKLQESLLRIPPNHPLAVECYEIEVALPRKLEDKGRDWERLVFECGEERRRLFNRYGFYGPADHDAVTFLKELRDAMKGCVNQPMSDLERATVVGSA